WEPWETFKRDDILGYREHLLKQIKQDLGASLCRMVSADNHVMSTLCCCILFTPDFSEIKDSIVSYNHLIFDFDTHELVVESLSNELPRHSNYDSLLYDCVRTLQRSIPQENPILFYRVAIKKLVETTKGFNHASYQCSYPAIEIDQFSFLDYTYLSHVHLAISQNNDHVFVLATYGGVAAL
ncbi:unnamed protein product, partial [Rotaria sp. Silwood2]